MIFRMHNVPAQSISIPRHARPCQLQRVKEKGVRTLCFPSPQTKSPDPFVFAHRRGLEFPIVFAVVLGGLCLRGGFGSVVGSVLAVAAIVNLQGIASWTGQLITSAGLLAALVLSQLYYAIVAAMYRSRALLAPPAPR